MNSTLNLVHPSWEFEDPTPDIHTLFDKFNEKFFFKKLASVELEWSKKMYSCAGICYSRRNNYGMSCTIRLSEPLLKLRSRKELLETLLHEMIHAFMFVQGVREGNGGHGPRFCKMMQEINNSAGTNITVYHNFHDEVNSYKTHWWRCNGVCQDRKPFFGFVKRTSNRAPAKTDSWWSQHYQSCGGSFIKVKEPEKLKRKKSDNKENLKKILPDIRKYFPTHQPRELVVMDKSSTFVVNGPTTSSQKRPSIFPNIHEYKNLYNNEAAGSSKDDVNSSAQIQTLYSGSGVSLGGFRKTSRLLDEDENLNRNSKRKCTQLSEVILINTTSDDENEAIQMSTQEIIKQELENEFEDDIILIDDEFDDSIETTEIHLANDGFLFDPLSSNVTGEMSPNSKAQMRAAGYSESEIDNMIKNVSSLVPLVSCPVCNIMLKEVNINSHLDLCLNHSLLDI